MGLTNGLVVMTPTSTAVTGASASATINSNGSVTFSSCTALSLNGIFTSSYDNYMITVRFSATLNKSVIFGRLRASGTDSTLTTDYNHQYLLVDSTTSTAARATTLGYWTMFRGDFTFNSASTAYLFGPQLAQPTAFRSVGVEGSTGGTIIDVGGTHELSTSYDGITMYPNSGTYTGLATVFGFNQ